MRERGGTWRFRWVGVTMTAAVAGLLFRLYMLHVVAAVPGPPDLAKGRSFERDLHGNRGRVLESGPLRNTLALNIDRKDLCIDPQRLQENDMVSRAARVLAAELDLDVDVLAVRFSKPGRRFEYVKRFVSPDEAERIMQLDLPGIFLRDSVLRHYPLESFLCHVIGFVNLEGVGSAGVEQQLNRWLTGTSGIRHELLDGGRREIPDRRIREVSPRAGADVVLTIDQTVQNLMEQALDGAMREHGARAAWAVAQRVRTGEILAMASRPAYDANEFRTSSEDQRLNRPIGMVFEPGSVMKPMVIAAAINEGLITPASVFDCENGSWIHARRPLRDYSPHGRLSVAEIMQKSSNIGTAKIALELGEPRLEQYLREFGFGSVSGIDLPGEEKGILHSHRRWSALCSSRIAIGQGVATTALQMLNAISAIANDGYLMQPYVVREVRRHGDGELLYTGEPKVLRRPISARTAADVTAMMRRVTEQGGTGRAASLDTVSVAGKTGTGQQAVDGRYSETDYTATFVGFFPAESPEISMLIVVDAPKPRYTGGAVAAPIFRQVAEPLVRYLDVGEPAMHLARTPQDGFSE